MRRLLPLLCWALPLAAQAPLEGRVTGPSAEGAPPLPGADVVWRPEAGAERWERADASGRFRVDGASGRGTLLLFHRGHATRRLPLDADTLGGPLDLALEPLGLDLGAVTVRAEEEGFGVRALRAVEGAAIYAARKTDLVELDRLQADRAGNNARQVFGRVAGLHVWESDAGGLQLGVGGRGLDPNRTAHFNTRQDGMDIAADALGYPESYYTPPAEATEAIEVVRGAASLQYGPQFGGLLHFRLRGAPDSAGLHGRTRQTAGSFGFLSTYTDLGFRRGAWSGFGFAQYRRSDGWRPFSGYGQHTGHVALGWTPAEGHALRAAVTSMRYLARQPGGLTDAAFADDARRAFRERNWFAVDWDLYHLGYRGRAGHRGTLDLRAFGVHAGKRSLGLLLPASRSDPGGPRDLLADRYANLGAEARWLRQFGAPDRPHVLLVGARAYRGHTERRQGAADAGDGPDFRFLEEGFPGGFDYAFPGANGALFAEGIWRPAEGWTVSPGLRAERIRTEATGTWRLRTTDLAGNVLVDSLVDERRVLDRGFVLLGLSASRRTGRAGRGEAYAGIAQNYRGITFNDLRVVNPNQVVDPDLTDERGFNAEAGWRGGDGRAWRADLSVFALVYRDRIGDVLRTDPLSFRSFRLRTNVADARSLGLEAYGELDWLAVFGPDIPKSKPHRLTSFLNAGWTHARYAPDGEPATAGKALENVPPLLLRGGLGWSHGAWRVTVQAQYVAAHFSDATNAEYDPSATAGRIPAYAVLDASAGWSNGRYFLQAGLNNATDARYFTRRATGYPGPGILPAEGRNAYLSFGVDW